MASPTIMVYVVSARDKCPRCSAVGTITITGKDKNVDVGFCSACETVVRAITIDVEALLRSEDIDGTD